MSELKFTRFERDITGIKGYALIDDKEGAALFIPVSPIINNNVHISMTNELLNDLLELINEGLK